MSKTLITSYPNPDLDGVACMVAYAELLSAQGHSVEAALFGAMHPEAEYLIQTYHLPPVPTINSALGDTEVILVDVSLVEQIDASIDPQVVTEIIDHRKINDAYQFTHAAIHIELVGSAATLVAERFQANNITPSRAAALLLYGAIVSNTLNFKANVTTERDRSMAHWLAQHIQLPDDFIRQVFAAKSDLTGSKLQQSMLSDKGVFTIAGKRCGIFQLEILDGYELAQKRKPEILAVVESTQQELNADFMALSIIDLEADQNIFMTADAETQHLYEKVLNVRFKDNVAVRPGFIMRKEITPKIREYLESSQ